MNNSNPQNSGQDQDSDIVGDENFENDDLITFQHDSITIHFYYSQLTKYSMKVRESYLFSKVRNHIPQEIHEFQEESQLLSENIVLFFQLLQQNYNLNEDSSFTYIQCIDLLKLSDFLKIRKLSFKIKQYIETHKIDIDFISQMIQYAKTQAETSNQQIKIGSEIEQILSSKINGCFSNEKFAQLPIEIIYRVISKSSPDLINCNKLFDMIKQSLTTFYVLFQFLDLQKLSNDRFEELCEMYSKSNENTRPYFDYLKCDLNFINEMNNRKKNLQEINDKQLKKMNDLETSFQQQLKESESKNAQLQNQLNEQQTQLNEQQNQLNEQQNQLNEQQKKMKDLESFLQKQLNELELKNAQLQKQSDENLIIKGEVVASVENGLFINAEINLKENGSKLDTTKSKVIVSTSNSKTLGSEAYDDGEPITSLHMNTRFACKPGKYYVRCIVFNSESKSHEIVSNSVATKSSCLTFGYVKSEPAKIVLPQGQYKLEVWGAKGGDSTGNGQCSRGNSTVPGGLGGYSRGILSLNKKETIYVFVGEQGRTSDSSDGSTTKGGFPDGGGTKISYCSKYHTVPGTGGGSTSIRIGSESNYSRVIVAGGGGGASGDCENSSPGGFGGGLSGGNCYYLGTIRDKGAGTQTGSTEGLSYRQNGDRGSFGLGASSKYSSTDHSGGGGGGGWFGGGGGGYGSHYDCSSGGGGSGWTFTESSFIKFQLGDSANASKFALTGSYYLTDVMCIGGNEEFPRPDGNGNERGHNGHGFAKITPL